MPLAPPQDSAGRRAAVGDGEADPSFQVDAFIQRASVAARDCRTGQKLRKRFLCNLAARRNGGKEVPVPTLRSGLSGSRVDALPGVGPAPLCGSGVAGEGEEARQGRPSSTAPHSGSVKAHPRTSVPGATVPAGLGERAPPRPAPATGRPARRRSESRPRPARHTHPPSLGHATAHDADFRVPSPIQRTSTTPPRTPIVMPATSAPGTRSPRRTPHPAARKRAPGRSSPRTGKTTGASAVSGDWSACATSTEGVDTCGPSRDGRRDEEPVRVV